MECLKCGRETVDKEVFCAECLKGMKNSPVSSSTPVVIHQRPEPQRKAPLKKAPKPEEVIAGLNQKIKRLSISLAVMSLLFAIAAGALGYVVWAEMEDMDIGSNYSTVTFPDEGGNH